LTEFHKISAVIKHFITQQQIMNHTLRITIIALIVISLLAMRHCRPLLEVEAVQIAFGNQPMSQITVSWHTIDSPDTYVPIVRYGTQSGNYTQTVTGGESVTYNRTAGFSHHVILDGLKPGTLYYYICGNDEVYSNEYMFRTAPLQNASGTMEMVVYGDLGVQICYNFVKNCTYKSYVVDRVQSRVLKNLLNPDIHQFVFHVGDISYANSASVMNPPQDFERIWNLWGSEIQSIAAHTPYMVCPGNHEYNKSPPCPQNATNFAPYNVKYRMPQFSSRKLHNMWYSFNYGNIHIISISTEV
jgi:hypothetical protein